VSSNLELVTNVIQVVKINIINIRVIGRFISVGHNVLQICDGRAYHHKC